MITLVKRAHDVLTGAYLLCGDQYLDDKQKALLQEELIKDLYDAIWKHEESAKLQELPRST